MAYLRILVCLAALLASPLAAQDVTEAQGAELRVLDKLTGAVIDMSLRTGETGRLGLLDVKLRGCRYPTSNPSGDAYVDLVVTYRREPQPIFAGWMLASAPALNAMDHPRYDVWALRCSIS